MLEIDVFRPIFKIYDSNKRRLFKMLGTIINVNDFWRKLLPKRMRC